MLNVDGDFSKDRPLSSCIKLQTQNNAKKIAYDHKAVHIYANILKEYTLNAK